MKIAFVSYEYPPATGNGGIGTYLFHVTRMLQRAGHHVEVFAGAGRGPCGSQEEEGVLVHRSGTSIPDYLETLGGTFAERHAVQLFDVCEAPEYFAQGGPVRSVLPEMPLVVKLHTPGYVIGRLNQTEFTTTMKLRRIIGALRRLQLPTRSPEAVQYDPSSDPEREVAVKASQVSSPSEAIWNEVHRTWGVPESLRFDVPLPFEPGPQLLAHPVTRNSKRIVFVGRLEVRKGIQELTAVLPRILAAHPDWKIQFIGKSDPSPDGRGDFSDWIRRRTTSVASQIEFTGVVTPQDVHRALGDAAIAVFPSRWESFGYVCLEAMAAGCAVVASRNGGMAELTDQGRCGLLVDPANSEQLGSVLLELMRSRSDRELLGELARQRVLETYSYEALTDRYLEGYRLAMNSKLRDQFCERMN